MDGILLGISDLCLSCEGVRHSIYYGVIRASTLVEANFELFGTTKSILSILTYYFITHPTSMVLFF